MKKEDFQLLKKAILVNAFNPSIWATGPGGICEFDTSLQTALHREFQCQGKKKKKGLATSILGLYFVTLRKYILIDCVSKRGKMCIEQQQVN